MLGWLVPNLIKSAQDRAVEAGAAALDANRQVKIARVRDTFGGL